MDRDGGHTQLPGNGRPSGAYALVMAAENKGSTALISQPNTAHDPEPVLSTSHPHNLFP